MRNHFVTFGALVLWCLAASAADQQRNKFVGILNLFPGYHVLTLADRDTETRSFLHQRFPKDNPSVVHADIDGDGHLDYALLLKNDKSSHAKFVVLLCSADDSCKKTYESDLTGYSEEVCLRGASSGSRFPRTEAIETPDRIGPLKPSATGIRVIYVGQAEVVYSWNKKHQKIEAIQTGD